MLSSSSFRSVFHFFQFIFKNTKATIVLKIKANKLKLISLEFDVDDVDEVPEAAAIEDFTESLNPL